MLGLILGAVRSRTAQAVILFGLTALTVAVTTAAPWYVISTARSVALAQVSNAQPSFLVARAVGTVRQEPGGQSGAAMLARAHTEGGAVLSVPEASQVASLWLAGALTGPGGPVRLTLAHREKACEELVIEGSCPGRAGEAVVSRRTAELLAVGSAGPVSFDTDRIDPMPLRIVGVYELRDPLAPYWALSELGAPAGDPASGGRAGDPAFVAPETMASAGVEELGADYHLVLPPRAFLGVDGYDVGAELTTQIAASSSSGWRVASNAPQLAERVTREQRLLYYGVAIAAAQLLVFCWAALFVALRHTAEQRRPDVGLTKLRGGAGWRVWLLVVAQSTLPMLAGALVGAAGGVAAARLLAGGIDDGDQVRLAVTLSVGATVAAIAGALLAALVADGRGMGASVVDLLRHIPARRRGWRADAVDLVVVVVAGAGIYQAFASASTSTNDAREEAAGVGLLAPALVAVVLALVVARLITPIATSVGRHALRAGRLPAALTATHLARRPGTHRVFALLTVATAILVTAISGWQAATEAGRLRAAHETGAEQVLTVQARNRAHLLAAVRAADPGGADAMAVVRNGSTPTMLAVDSSRFARVAVDQPEYRPPGTTDLASLLRPAAPAPVGVPEGVLTLDASGAGVARPPVLLAHLVAANGDPLTAAFGPLDAGRAGHSATVTGCGATAGCRLIGFELVEPTPSGGFEPAPAGSRADIYGLAGTAGPVLGGAEVGDVRRWRATMLAGVLAPTVAPGPGRLALTAPGPPPGPNTARSTLAYLVDAPVPVPVLRTGLPPEILPGDPRLTFFGGNDLPVRFVGVPDALPQVSGSGFLVDLEYADRLAVPGGLGDVLQVWLGPQAPAGMPDRLREQGLQILSVDSSAAARDRLDRRGPPSALRFQLATGVIGLLLAAGALTLVAAVERSDRTAELAALRVQGLPAAAVRRLAYGGQLLVVGSAVLLGVGAAVLAGLVVPAAMPTFVDNWRALSLPSGPGPLSVLLAALTGLLVLGAAGVASAAQLLRAAERRSAAIAGRPGANGVGAGAGRRPGAVASAPGAVDQHGEEPR